MKRTVSLLLIVVLPCLLLAAAGAYQYFVGFPTTIAGRRVHRVTVWAEGNRFQRERIFYAYTGPDGRDVRHGLFERFEAGKLVQQATYHDGKIDGTMTFWNLLGEKTQEIFYRSGTPYGWANYGSGKLVTMRQEIFQDGRTVAVENFADGRYSLEFKCGELIKVAIDPTSGQVSPIANPSQRACVRP